jgi:PAS domain S-box-containing protein
MAATGLSLLQKAARSASGCASREEGISNLTKAFQLFSEETSRLESAYESLQKNFQVVNHELEESNQRLNQNLVELDSVTNYLNNILCNIQQGIIFVGLSGDVTTFNSAAEEILGCKREKILFSSFWDHFDNEIFGFSMKDALQKKVKCESLIFSLEVEKGLVKDIEVTISLVSEGSESNHGVIVLLREVTEFFRLQRLANRNERLKELGEMAASVAHEIRNPLGGIEGFASLLCRDLKDRPESCKMASQIVDGTRALNDLVSRVLNYSQPLNVCYEKVDLRVLLEKARSFLLMDSSFPSNISIILDFEDDGLEAFIDPNLLNFALYNLVINAVHAMENGGEVTISLKDEGHEFLVVVADTGVGISAENLEKIYSPFFTTKHNGNGFGLSEVYKVIQAHDGAIEVFSKVKQGTRFVIKMPKTATKSQGSGTWL